MIEFENYINDFIQFPVEIFVQDSLKKPIQVKEHWHNCFEFLYILQGEARHIVNGHTYDLKEKQLVVILSGGIHAIYCDENIHTRIFVLKFTPSLINVKHINAYESKYLSAFMNKKQVVPLLSNEQKGYIENIFEKMETEIRNEEKGYEYIVQGYILQYVGYLVREKILDFAQDVNKDTHTVLEIIKYIEENYSYDINLSDIANNLHMNYYYTSRYFKKLTGKNFKQFIDFVRLSESNRLLVETDQTITAIALMCGFSCPQSMSRTYRRLLGVTPREIRHQSVS